MTPDTPETTADECPECCCVERICCESVAKAMAALVTLQMRELGCSREEATPHAALMFRHFALVPKEIQPFIAKIAKLARQAHADGL